MSLNMHSIEYCFNSNAIIYHLRFEFLESCNINSFVVLFRTNTVILVGFDDICDFRERTIHSHHQCENPEYSEAAYTFKIEPLARK